MTKSNAARRRILGVPGAIFTKLTYRYQAARGEASNQGASAGFRSTAKSALLPKHRNAWLDGVLHAKDTAGGPPACDACLRHAAAAAIRASASARPSAASVASMPGLTVLPVSARTGEGMNAWFDWLRAFGPTRRQYS